VTKTIQVKATGTDGGGSAMASVTFYLDGVLQTVVSGTGPYQWAWNTAKTTKGQHIVTAVAVDNAGNTSSGSITVTVA
jgi:hypothetical protein